MGWGRIYYNRGRGRCGRGKNFITELLRSEEGGGEKGEGEGVEGKESESGRGGERRELEEEGEGELCGAP